MRFEIRDSAKDKKPNKEMGHYETTLGEIMGTK